MANTSARPADELERVMQTYGNMLFRIALITLGNASDAEDAVQDTLIKYMQKAPYSIFETLGIHNYQILDKNGKMVVKGAETTSAAINDGQVELLISLEGVPTGEYKLVVTELVGSAKADQPLAVSGTWECGFTKSE